jgi:hypothetical protein
MNFNLDATAIRILSALAVAAVGFAAGACGDDSSSSTPAGGGATGGGGDFWPSAAYGAIVANPPSPVDTDHPPGITCMTCHAMAGEVGGNIVLLYGGTVYAADGMTPAGGVEVGVRYNGQVFSTTSNAQGNFGVEAAAPMASGAHEVRMRSAAGEIIKLAGEVSEADCNSCHSAAGEDDPLITP